MKLIGALFTAASVLNITGCAIEAVPISFADARPVPFDRVFLYQRPVGVASIAVQVKRDIGIPASGCAADLLVGGKLAATLKTGEKTTLYLPPGRTFLSVTPHSGACGHTLSEIETMVAGQEAQRFRISATSSGQMTILATGTD